MGLLSAGGLYHVETEKGQTQNWKLAIVENIIVCCSVKTSPSLITRTTSRPHTFGHIVYLTSFMLRCFEGVGAYPSMCKPVCSLSLLCIFKMTKWQPQKNKIQRIDPKKAGFVLLSTDIHAVLTTTVHYNMQTKVYFLIFFQQLEQIKLLHLNNRDNVFLCSSGPLLSLSCCPPFFP